MNEEIRKMLILLQHELDSGKFCREDAYHLNRKISKFFHPDMNIREYNIVKKGLDCEIWCDARQMTENGMCKLIDRCWLDLEEGFERIEQ